jgi:hypothetical protein
MALLNQSFTALIASTYTTVAKTSIPAIAIPFCQSEENVWCWAACGEMMSKKKYSQGVIANTALGRTDCNFPRPLNTACITTIKDSEIERLAKTMFGFNHCSLMPSDISFRSLEAQIRAHQMVEAGFTWSSTKLGHVVLLVATDNTGGIDTVTLHDPDKSKAIVNILYTDLQKAYGQGQWDATWLDMY